MIRNTGKLSAGHATMDFVQRQCINSAFLRQCTSLHTGPITHGHTENYNLPMELATEAQRISCFFCHQGFFATYVRQTNAKAIGAVNTFIIVFVSVFVKYSASKSEKAVNNFPVITGVLRARDSYGNSTRQPIPYHSIS